MFCVLSNQSLERRIWFGAHRGRESTCAWTRSLFRQPSKGARDQSRRSGSGSAVILIPHSPLISTDSENMPGDIWKGDSADEEWVLELPLLQDGLLRQPQQNSLLWMEYTSFNRPEWWRVQRIRTEQMAIDGRRGVEARKSNQNCTDLDGVYVKSVGLRQHLVLNAIKWEVIQGWKQYFLPREVEFYLRLVVEEGQHLRRFVQKMSKIHWYRYTLNIVKSKMEDMYLNIKSEA